MTLLVSEHAARFLQHEAKRDPRRHFNTPVPHYCKACDQPVPPARQAAHVRSHASELAALAKQRQQEAVKKLRAVTRLRREARAA